MLSTYVISLILLLSGVGMSDVYILNSVGESTVEGCYLLQLKHIIMQLKYNHYC